MKSIRDIARAAVLAGKFPRTYEGLDYARFGGDRYTAVDARRRLILLDAAMRDSGWRTIHGVHVHIGDGGKIDKGPAALVGKSHAEATDHVKSKGHDHNDQHVRAEKAMQGHIEKKKPHEIGMAVSKATRTLGHDHPLVQHHDAAKNEGAAHSSNDAALISHVHRIGDEADLNDHERHQNNTGTNTRENVPAEVGRHFQGHGVGTARGLVELLRSGIDSNRQFHTEQLSGVPTGVAMLRDNQPFMVVGGHGDEKLKGGIKSVIVSGYHHAAIPALQKAFPSVNFIANDAAAGELTRQATLADHEPAAKAHQKAQDHTPTPQQKGQFVGKETREDSLNRYRIARGLGLDVAKPKHGSEMGYLDDADQKAFEHHLDSEYEARHGVIDENDHPALTAAGRKLDYGHDTDDVIGPLVHQATTEPVNDGTHRVIFRASIERRLMEHHAERGGESDDFDVDGEHAGEYASVGSERNRTFHGSLPGEVKNFLQGRYHLRRLFKTTSNPSAAGGADALGELGVDRYMSAVERMGRGKLGRAIDAGKQSEDPEIRFLAHVHTNAAPTPRGEKRQHLVHMPTDNFEAGHSFTIHGEHFHVHEPEEGERVLLGPSHYPELPLDAATHVPIDRGSLRRRKRADVPARSDDFAPFSRTDARARLIEFANPNHGDRGRFTSAEASRAALHAAAVEGSPDGPPVPLPPLHPTAIAQANAAGIKIDDDTTHHADRHRIVHAMKHEGMTPDEIAGIVDVVQKPDFVGATHGDTSGIKRIWLVKQDEQSDSQYIAVYGKKDNRVTMRAFYKEPRGELVRQAHEKGVHLEPVAKSDIKNLSALRDAIPAASSTTPCSDSIDRLAAPVNEIPALSAPGRSASGISGGTRRRLAELSRALSLLQSTPPARS